MSKTKKLEKWTILRKSSEKKKKNFILPFAKNGKVEVDWLKQHEITLNFNGFCHSR